MTEHIINFAIGIEDETIANEVQKNAEKQITNDIKLEVLERIFESRSYYSNKAVKQNSQTGNVTVDKDAKLRGWVEDLILKALESDKDKIIEEAVKVIANKYTRSKAFKEKIGEELQ